MLDSAASKLLNLEQTLLQNEFGFGSRNCVTYAFSRTHKDKQEFIPV